MQTDIASLFGCQLVGECRVPKRMHSTARRAVKVWRGDENDQQSDVFA